MDIIITYIGFSVWKTSSEVESGGLRQSQWTVKLKAIDELGWPEPIVNGI